MSLDLHLIIDYRLHINSDGTFVNPIRVYDGKVYLLDNVATRKILAVLVIKDL